MSRFLRWLAGTALAALAVEFVLSVQAEKARLEKAGRMFDDPVSDSEFAALFADETDDFDLMQNRARSGGIQSRNGLTYGPDARFDWPPLTQPQRDALDAWLHLPAKADPRSHS